MQKVSSILQIIFYVVVSGATIWSLYLAYSLIYTPVVGVTGVETKRLLEPGLKDTYDNVKAAQTTFSVRNVGNLPAKNVIINLTWKIGNTSLPVTQRPQSREGIYLLQGMTTSITLTFGKDIIERMIVNKERLVVTYDFSYSDWIGYKTYHYPSFFEIEVTNKEPLLFQVFPISNP